MYVLNAIDYFKNNQLMRPAAIGPRYSMNGPHVSVR